MDYKEFDEQWQIHAPSQDKFEYFLYLRFVQDFFAFRGVVNPVVVEIGVRQIAQAAFYTRFFNARYIGIDIAPKKHPDIIRGDSTHINTLHELIRKLGCAGQPSGSRPIDLLFIDGWHSYKVARSDWDMYSPLVKHLVGIHDINWEMNYFHGIIDQSVREPSVSRLWKELYNEGESMISFQCPGTFEVVGKGGSKVMMGDPGIGVVIMDRDVIEKRWVFKEDRFKEMWGEDGIAYPRRIQ